MPATASIMKSRLRRLLGSSGRSSPRLLRVVKTNDLDNRGNRSNHNNNNSSNSNNDGSVDTQSVSSTESTVSSVEDLCQTNNYPCNNHGTARDPFADVRDRLEELAGKNRSMAVRNNCGHQGWVHTDEGIPPAVAYLVYLSYAVLILMGHLRDACAVLLQRGRYLRRQGQRSPQPRSNAAASGYPSDNPKEYAALLKSWENFFTRRLYSRIQDAFNRPIASNPGSEIVVLERVSDDGQKTMQVLGGLENLDTDAQRRSYQRGEHYTEAHDGSVARQCLNLGSYNYLGFADDWAHTCSETVKGSLDGLPVSASSARNEYGTTCLHRELEETVASFLGKQDALVLNMGFNTNATTIPALTGRGDLLLSDELNHTSIVAGARASGAAIRIFRHNDMEHLEAVLRESIIQGRPRTRRPWNKILVLVEGIYSMEGEYCNLRGIVKLCKKYGAYVYLDEAHSIGAMGPTGRGISEYLGVDTADIDIMMGTFTKSFGGMGGYIAGKKDVIDYLRQRCSGSAYHNALSPVVCQQVITSFKVIMGQDGTDIGKKKLQALRDNANYFRMRLREMGLQVLGQYDSPIMPVMLYHPGKISGFSRECLKRGLAVVVVGFPAVPLLMSRARFCISAGHTREQLDRAIKEIDEIADILKIRYSPHNAEAMALRDHHPRQS